MDDVAAVITLLKGPVGTDERLNALGVTQILDDPCRPSGTSRCCWRRALT
jgi:hypothetical protein